MFRCSIGARLFQNMLCSFANFTLIFESKERVSEGLMWTIPRATTHHIRPRNPCPPVPFCAELHVDTFCNSSGSSSLPSDFFVHFRVFSLHLGARKTCPTTFCSVFRRPLSSPKTSATIFLDLTKWKTSSSGVEAHLSSEN